MLEDRLAPVTSIHDVVDRAGILDSELAGHAVRLFLPDYMSVSRTDPFFDSLLLSFPRIRRNFDPNCEFYCAQLVAVGTE